MTKLSDTELDELASMRVRAGNGNIGFWQIYQWLGDLLHSKGVADTDSTLIWLRGATEANYGRGAMAALIRTYTETQYRLRYGNPIPDGDLQRASDAVAGNLLDDLLGVNANWERGVVPDISRIGQADATAVGRVLFNANPNDSAAELQQNSAWAGTLLFTPLGSDQTGRLMATGIPSSVDTLSDWRDVLFAHAAYAKGLQAAYTAYWAGGEDQKDRDFKTFDQTITGFLTSSGGYSAVLDTVMRGTSNPVLKAAFTVIGNVGDNRFLDMLMGAVSGKSLLGSTTDVNFADKAQSFFGTYGTTLKNIGVVRLSVDASTLAQQARTDINVRAALAALSFVRVDAISAAARDRLGLFDPVTGLGDITEEWITDRAGFLANFYKKQDGLGGIVSGSTNQRFLDVATGTEVLVGAGSAQRQQYVFGGAAADAISGQGFADRLYGGAGNDTLAGLGGSDFLQGDEGDDTLDGGAGNDTLVGGTGSDVYKFTDGWGTDTIADSDGNGSIQVEGIGTLTGSGAKKVAEGIWQTSDKKISYVPVAAGNGRFDLYITFSDRTDLIIVRDWSTSRSLGISLPDAVPELPAETSELIGDFKKATNDTRYVISSSGYVNVGEQQDAADVLIGTGNADTIRGLGGNDAIAAGDGDDLIEGGVGDDLLAGGKGADHISGGDGNDIVFGSGTGELYTPADLHFEEPWVPAGGYQVARGFSWVGYRGNSPRWDGATAVMRLVGLVGADLHAFAGDEGNYIDGGAGNDYIAAGTGDDIAHGGIGDDDIMGMGGADVLYGDEGDDFIWGDGVPDVRWAHDTPAEEHGDDLLVGGAGNDVLVGQGGADVLLGGTGNDSLWGDGGIEAMPFGAVHGSDYLDGGEGDDSMRGGGGDDILIGGAGSDAMWGDDASMYISNAVHGNDRLDGGAGNDTMNGGGGDDTLLGGSGNDQLWGDGAYNFNNAIDAAIHGNDNLEGGEGNDTLIGGGLDDVLYGGAGNDIISGDDALEDLAPIWHGNDHLDGGAGDDQLRGGGGNDTLIGGAGVDRLEGGAGNDTYIFSRGDSEASSSLADGIVDLEGSNTVILQDVMASEVAVSIRGDDILLQYSAKDTLLVQGGRQGAIDKFQFADGQTLNWTQLLGSSQSDPVDLQSAVSGAKLVGGAGNDVLKSSGGGALISGGKGDDLIRLGGGANEYLFNRGDGNDTVSESANGALIANVIRMGAGITASDLTLGRHGDYLTLNVHNPASQAGPDSIKFLSYDVNSTLTSFGVGVGYRIVFSDGSETTLSALMAGGLRIDGGAAGDDLIGTALDDVVSGSAENDRLHGMQGNDRLYGGDGDDVLDGGAGNDRLVGGSGIDAYRLGRDQGLDLVIDDSGTIRLDAGIALSDLALVRSGNDLRLSPRGDSGGIVLENYFATSSAWTVAAADGQHKTVSEIWTASQNATPLLADQLRRDFEAGIQADFGVRWTAMNRYANADGGYVQRTSWSNGLNRELVEERETMIVSSLVDGQPSGASSVTLANNTITDRWFVSPGYGGQLIINLTDSVEKLVRRDIQSDNAVIVVARVGRSEQVISGYKLVEVQWTMLDGTRDSSTSWKTDGIISGTGTEPIRVYSAFHTRQKAGQYWVPGLLTDAGPGQSASSGYARPQYVMAGYAQVVGQSEYVVVQAGAGDNAIVGGDIIYAGEGNDHVQLDVRAFVDAGLGNDIIDGAGVVVSDPTKGAVLYGNGGNDSITGTSGADVLSGGAGSDWLVGGLGNDEYRLVEADDSIDWIQDDGGNDSIAFSAGVALNELKLTRGLYPAGSGIGYLEIAGPSGAGVRVRLGADGSPDVERIAFSDGSSVQTSALMALAMNERIHGSDAADILSGGIGDDYLIGGKGNDSMAGGVGNDVYVIVRGDGHDVVDQSASRAHDTDVLYLEGISASEIAVSRVDNDLRLSLNSGAQTVTLQGWWDASISRIDLIRFGDGSTWDEAALLSRVPIDPPDGVQVIEPATPSGIRQMIGTAGADTIVGRAGGDRIFGHEGNDVLMASNGEGNSTQETDVLDGGAGNDVYLIEQGGPLAIIDQGSAAEGDFDALRFGPGISFQDLVVGHENWTDLWLQTQDGRVVAHLNDWWSPSVVRLSQLEFDDGSVYLSSQLDEMITKGYYRLAEQELSAISGGESSQMVGNDLDNYLAGGENDDILYGEEGHDSLVGGAGDDVFYGGAGSDYLQGGIGNDTYVFNSGDGVDTIAMFAAGDGFDMIQFGAGLNASSLLAARQGDDLVLSFFGTTDAIRLSGWWDSAATQSLAVQFSDGTRWTAAELTDLVGTAQPPETGPGGDDDAPKQTSANVDVAWDGWSRTSVGSDGNDVIVGGAGADWMFGGDGDDILRAWEDPSSSSGYYDYLEGNGGNDVYYIDRSGPTSSINQSGANATDIDVVRFGSGIDAADLKIQQVNESYLNIYQASTGQLLAQLQQWWDPSVRRVDHLQFSDGTVIQGSQLDSMIQSGLYSADNYAGAVVGRGEATALFYGNASDNVLIGGSGDDMFDPWKGNDLMEGGLGSDTYNFSADSESDVIVENDIAGSGSVDVVQIYGDISAEQLWFSREDDDLQVNIIGTDNRLAIRDWFIGDTHRIEEFRLASGGGLLDGQVQNLVSAMAAFSPPAAGQTTLPANYQSSLNTVIAANWQ